MRVKAISHESLSRLIICVLLLIAASFAAASAYAQAPPPIIVSPDSLPNGTVGVFYSQTLSATGGLGAPYSWSVTSGTLPTGLSLGPPTFGATVQISGTPSASGSFSFTITATDDAGSKGSRSYSILISSSAPCPQTPMVRGVVVTPTLATPGSTFTVSWIPLGNFSGSYGVFRSTDAGKNFQLLATTSNTSYTGTVTDPVGTTITFEVQAFANCVYPTLSNFVTLTVVSSTCNPPGAVSNIQVQSAGVNPPRAPAPTEYIAVSFTAPAGGTAPVRYGVRVNGEQEISVQGTSVTLLPRGARLDPIQVFVKAYACSPERAGSEAASAALALFLTSPRASFTVSPNPRVSAPVVFTDTSSPQATSWLWVFDDGTTDQGQSPSHVFTAPGPHVVYLFASNGAGSSQTSQVVTVGAAAAVFHAERVIGIDARDPMRRRARVQIGESGRAWLRVRALGSEEVVLFLRFLDEAGEMVVERRLVVEPEAEGVYDLSAYGLSGEYAIELVGGGEYEPTLTVVGRKAREVER